MAAAAGPRTRVPSSSMASGGGAHSRTHMAAAGMAVMSGTGTVPSAGHTSGARAGRSDRRRHSGSEPLRRAPGDGGTGIGDSRKPAPRTHGDPVRATHAAGDSRAHHQGAGDHTAVAPRLSLLKRKLATRSRSWTKPGSRRTSTDSVGSGTVHHGPPGGDVNGAVGGMYATGDGQSLPRCDSEPVMALHPRGLAGLSADFSRTTAGGPYSDAPDSPSPPPPPPPPDVEREPAPGVVSDPSARDRARRVEAGGVDELSSLPRSRPGGVDGVIRYGRRRSSGESSNGRRRSSGELSAASGSSRGRRRRVDTSDASGENTQPAVRVSGGSASAFNMTAPTSGSGNDSHVLAPRPGVGDNGTAAKPSAANKEPAPLKPWQRRRRVPRKDTTAPAATTTASVASTATTSVRGPATTAPPAGSPSAPAKVAPPPQSDAGDGSAAAAGADAAAAGSQSLAEAAARRGLGRRPRLGARRRSSGKVAAPARRGRGPRRRGAPKRNTAPAPAPAPAMSEARTALCVKWGEVMFLLRKPVKTGEQIANTARAARDGLRFLDEVDSKAAELDVLRGSLSRWLLPYDSNTPTMDQAAGAAMTAEAGSVEAQLRAGGVEARMFEASIPDEVRSSLARARLRATTSRI